MAAGDKSIILTDKNVKTINGESVLGAGDITVQPTLVSGTNIKTISGQSLLGSGDVTISSGVIGNYTEKWMMENIYTSSQSVTVPTGATKCRAYVFGVGGNGTNSQSGGGGGCAYGEFNVTAGQSVILTINQTQGSTSTLVYGGVTLLTAVGANNATAGTASKDVSIVNGGAYSGGNGFIGGGSSSGSPFGNGKQSYDNGGASWTYSPTVSSGAGLGSAGKSTSSGKGLSSSAKITDPLILYFRPFGGETHSGFLGGNQLPVDGASGSGGAYSAQANTPGGSGGFGAGGGASTHLSGTATAGAGGFGAGGGSAVASIGGNGGLGGGGGGSGNAGANNGGQSCIVIFWSAS